MEAQKKKEKKQKSEKKVETVPPTDKDKKKRKKSEKPITEKKPEDKPKKKKNKIIKSDVKITDVKQPLKEKRKKGKNSAWLFTLVPNMAWPDENDPNLMPFCDAYKEVIGDILGDDDELQALLKIRSNVKNKTIDSGLTEFRIERGPERGYVHCHGLVHLKHNSCIRFDYPLVKKTVFKEFKKKCKKLGLPVPKGLYFHADFLDKLSGELSTKENVLNYINKNMKKDLDFKGEGVSYIGDKDSDSENSFVAVEKPKKVAVQNSREPEPEVVNGGFEIVNDIGEEDDEDESSEDDDAPVKDGEAEESDGDESDPFEFSSPDGSEADEADSEEDANEEREFHEYMLKRQQMGIPQAAPYNAYKPRIQPPKKRYTDAQFKQLTAPKPGAYRVTPKQNPQVINYQQQQPGQLKNSKLKLPRMMTDVRRAR